MGARKNEVVILLHGLGRSPLSMVPLALAFRWAGYDVANWGYASWRGGMAEQIERLRPHLAELTGYSRVHGVGHSLGGLLLRGLLGDLSDRLPLGRLVMMGTPNSGAGMIHHHAWLFRRGPLNLKIIHDLAAHSPAIRALPVPAMETGIIAGIEKFNPFNPVSWLNRATFGEAAHDGTVELSSTRLPQMQDFMTLRANHSFILWHRAAIKAAVRFIQTGRFT